MVALGVTMQKLFKSLFLEPEDIGIQKLSESELAKKMSEVALPEDDSLRDFAALVSKVLDDNDASLTSISSGLDKSRR